MGAVHPKHNYPRPSLHLDGTRLPREKVSGDRSMHAIGLGFKSRFYRARLPHEKVSGDRPVHALGLGFKSRLDGALIPHEKVSVDRHMA